MTKNTIMLIDRDTFFVPVDQVLNPEFGGKPLVVGGKHVGMRGGCCRLL